jgi:WD40 repeat protein
MSRAVAFVLAAAVVASLNPAPAQTAKLKLGLIVATEVTVDSEPPLRSLVFSPNGKLLAVGAEDVFLFDVTSKAVTPTGTVIKAGTPTGKTSVRAMAFTPDGKYLLFGSGDNSVRVWDVAGKAEAWQAKAHQRKVMAAVVSADGKMAATGGADKSTIVWTLAADGKLTEYAVLRDEQKDQTVRGLAFLPKGGLVVAGETGTFRGYTFGKDGPKLSGGFAPKGSLGVGHVVANPGATIWAVPSGPNVILVTAAGAGVGTLGGMTGHKRGVLDASFSPDGKLVASCGQDGQVIVWDVAKKDVKYAKSRPGEFTAVAFSPKADEGTGDVTVAAGLEGGIIHVLKLGYR